MKSYQDFQKVFVHEYTIITHEFSIGRTYLNFGKYKDQPVVLKEGRFLQSELEIHKQIRTHPNVVTYITEVHNFGDNESYILMERIDGDSLHNLLNSNNRNQFSIEVCLDIMQQVAKGIQHLHHQGIIHHDLTSNNILITNSEPPIAKICDFGVSEKVDENGYGNSNDRILGTTCNKAPEQGRHSSEPITMAIDIYAYSGICNTILYIGRNSIDQIFSDTPLMLLHLINKCQEKNIKERPSINDIIWKLNDIEKQKDTWDTKWFELYKSLKK